MSPTTDTRAAKEPPAAAEARSRASDTTTADAAVETEGAVAAAATGIPTLVAGAADLESSEVKPGSTESVVGDVAIGDVPGFVAAIAVGGILPEICFGGEAGWLQASLSEAFRREAADADGGDGSDEVRLPAQVRVLGCPFFGEL